MEDIILDQRQKDYCDARLDGRGKRAAAKQAGYNSAPCESRKMSQYLARVRAQDIAEVQEKYYYKLEKLYEALEDCFQKKDWMRMILVMNMINRMEGFDGFNHHQSLQSMQQLMPNAQIIQGLFNAKKQYEGEDIGKR